MSKETNFIEKIAPFCQKYAKKFGYKICSAAIAQACLESAYGTSEKAAHHNYFGLKYRPGRIKCNNGYFEAGGSEQNPNGTYILLPTNTAWYNFDNMEEGVRGYYEFLSIPNYAKVKEANTPLEYLQAIKDAHYATSINYVQNVYNVVTKYNLTQYDNLNKPIINNNSTNNIAITYKISNHNITRQDNRKIEWIVLHYTAGTISAKGTAQNVAAYFAKTGNQASADFIVDDGEIVQYNPDLTNYYCWAVGGSKYTSLSNSLAAKYYGQCKNNNSISIEMCSRKKNTSTLNASDDDWYLTQETIDNAVKITKYLMKEYNIDINHVIMHNMVTGKWCPQPWCKNEQALQNWNNFINQVKGAGGTTSQLMSNETKVPVPPAFNSYIVKITADVLNVRTGPGTNYPVITKIKDKGKYTIMEESNGWGLLKAYQKLRNGWISLKYTKKV